MNKTEKLIAEWLKREGKDRAWLATKIGSTLGSVNQFFSKGFPDWAMKSIDHLMNPPGAQDGGLEVAFTAREFERIEQARALLGIASRKLFYEEAIAEFTDKILATEKDGEKSKAKNISHFPTGEQATRVAEDPPANGPED